MIDTQAIRSKILDYAISGLFTNGFDEETGKELVMRIKNKRKQFEKKRTKKALEYSNTVPPFVLPEGWDWVSLETICSNIPNAFADGPFGSNLKREHYTTKKQVRIIQLSNVGIEGWKNTNEKYTSFEHLATIQRSEVKSGNIVIAKMMPAGRAIVVPDGIADSFVLSSDCIKFVPSELLNSKYICYAINSKWFHDQVIKDIHGIGRERTSLSKLRNCCIPIPSLAEQSQIVSLMDNTIKILNNIDELQAKYADNLTALKSKLIDAAIQGKLTEQLPEDGTAEKLYQQIQEEKQKLIKEGKIKKQKPLPEITDNEIPFDIPANWKWVRIGDIFTLQSGKNISAASIKTDKDDNCKYMCYGGNGLRGFVNIFNVDGNHAIIGRQGALCGNINFAEGKFYATEHAVVVYEYANTCVTWAGVFLRALNLNQYATSVAQPGLAVGKINHVLIPLPPLAEQKRIVQKLEEILPLCEKLK